MKLPYYAKHYLHPKVKPGPFTSWKIVQVILSLSFMVGVHFLV